MADAPNLGSTTPPGRHRPQRAWWRVSLIPQHGHTRALAAVVVLALVAVAAVLLALRPEGHKQTALPPTPPSPVASSSIGRSTSTPPTARASERPITCGRAARSPLGGTGPTRICIPSIRVDASIMQLGLNADRTVQVPPLSRVGDAGWYKYSAAPGAVGPTVILGHVDSAQYGTGVFFKLGQLRTGAQVNVSRDDGRTATFRIDRVVEVSKSKFPSQAVYGPTKASALRLVTCGGRFDAATGNYVDNIIAYGTLESVASA